MFEEPWQRAIVTLICWHEGLTEAESYKVWDKLKCLPVTDVITQVRMAIMWIKEES